MQNGLQIGCRHRALQRVQPARVFQISKVIIQGLDQFIYALSRDRNRLAHRRFPSDNRIVFRLRHENRHTMVSCPRTRAIQSQHRLQRHGSGVSPLTIRLVDHEDVGNLEDTGLDGLNIVAQAGHFDDDGGVCRRGDFHFRLAGPPPFR